MKVSIIVPCYKVEAYLHTFMDGIKAQTFKDFEVIFVHDGGSQDQLDILNEISAEHENAIVIAKENQGVGPARNTGIKKARGAWIAFVDPDDSIEPYYLENLFGAAAENTELVIGGYKFFYSRHNRTEPNYIEHTDLSSKKDIFESLARTIFNPVWNKLYKKEIIEDHKIEFPPGISQDVIFNYAYFLKAERITLIRDSGLIYFLRDELSETSCYSPGLKERLDQIKKLREQTYKSFVDDHRVVREKMHQTNYLFAYFVTINLFKHKSPLTFREKRDFIVKKIKGDASFTDAFKSNSVKKNGLLKLFHFSMSLPSSLLTVACLEAIFKVKYNFIGVYSFFRASLNK